MMKSLICRGDVNPVTSTGSTGASGILELIDNFSYLGDMFSVDADADAALEVRIRIVWNKFRQLVSLLINMDISLTVRGLRESSNWYRMHKSVGKFCYLLLFTATHYLLLQ